MVDLDTVREILVNESGWFHNVVLEGYTLLIDGQELEELGSGSEGTALKVHSEKANGPLVLKVLENGVSTDMYGGGESIYFQAFRNESDRPSGLLQIHFVSDDGCYILSEYCGKKGLDDLNREEARKICSDPFELWNILMGLSKLHEKGIIHRDIKPENIFVRDNNSLSIGDFGISKYYEDCFEYSDGVGTPNYRAPEALDSRKICDLRKCDIYSLGMTLLEIFTLGERENLSRNFFGIKGNGVFVENLLHTEGDKYAQVIKNKLDSVTPPINEDIKRIIVRACEPDINKRASLDELMAIVEGMKKKKLGIEERTSPTTEKPRTHVEKLEAANVEAARLSKNGSVHGADI
jgi:serine/threonine protein kinase